MLWKLITGSITDITVGDLNSDDVIDSEDIVILANFILIGEYTFLSDLNSDNKLDILDLLAIVEIISF